MPEKTKTVFVCSSCGAQFSKWSGQCKECGEWNTLDEEVVIPEKKSLFAPISQKSYQKAEKFSEIPDSENDGERYKTGIGELDRALGGGIVRSSVALISGEPGIGKSTLLLQICKSMPNQKVLYVSGEESKLQIKIRAKRIGALTDNVYLLCENDIDIILEETSRISPDILIIDSIQTIKDSSVNSQVSGISQVKQVSQRLISETKQNGFSTIIVGHVNKDGMIAGPKLLEHMVDVVLYYEGERTQGHRILRAAKNRYGSTNEIGLFEMTDTGLEEVPDPSRRLLEDSPKNVSGSCPVCLMEGTRPIMSEVQALISKSPFPVPKRLSNGLDFNRMSMILAVIEKRLGIKFFDKDVYINVVGGLKLDETATDLGVCAAILSGALDLRLSGETIAIGEVGLSGECRAVGDVDVRVGEAIRLGFKNIIIPKKTLERLKKRSAGVNYIGVRSVYELLDAIKTIKD